MEKRNLINAATGATAVLIMADTTDLTQFSRIRRPGKSLRPARFTDNPRRISRQPSTLLVNKDITQERNLATESILAFGKFALTKILSMPILGPAGVSASAIANSDGSGQEDRSWHDDYLIGKSDMDAIWYYERRRWRS